MPPSRADLPAMHITSFSPSGRQIGNATKVAPVRLEPDRAAYRSLHTNTSKPARQGDIWV